jgi:hypothetical protein
MHRKLVTVLYEGIEGYNVRDATRMQHYKISGCEFHDITRRTNRALWIISRAHYLVCLLNAGDNDNAPLGSKPERVALIS